MPMSKVDDGDVSRLGKATSHVRRTLSNPCYTLSRNRTFDNGRTDSQAEDLASVIHVTAWQYHPVYTFPALPERDVALTWPLGQ